MLAALALLAALLRLAPAPATSFACRVAGLERFEPELLRILEVESRGQAVGVHRGHHPRKPGRVFWERAVTGGWLQPDTCGAHALGLDGGAGWGIRGAHGQAAAYAVRELGPCVGAAALDVPFLSAVAAVRRLRRLERTYGLRTPEARALAWRVGVGAARPE